MKVFSFSKQCCYHRFRGTTCQIALTHWNPSDYLTLWRYDNGWASTMTGISLNKYFAKLYAKTSIAVITISRPAKWVRAWSSLEGGDEQLDRPNSQTCTHEVWTIAKQVLYSFCGLSSTHKSLPHGTILPWSPYIKELHCSSDLLSAVVSRRKSGCDCRSLSMI